MTDSRAAGALALGARSSAPGARHQTSSTPRAWYDPKRLTRAAMLAPTKTQKPRHHSKKVMHISIARTAPSKGRRAVDMCITFFLRVTARPAAALASLLERSLRSGSNKAFLSLALHQQPDINMLSCPRIGDQVRIHYNKRICRFMPLHEAVGHVRVRSTRRPRNHGVEVGGVLYVIPAGNLYRAEITRPVRTEPV